MIRWLFFALILLFLVRLWPRAVFVILAAAVLVGGGAFVWTRHLDEERAQVAISVVHDPGCPAARPLSVTIRNTAAVPLERITFSLHARMPGYSRVVTPPTFRQYESDKILSPGESFSACYPRPLMSRDALPETAGADLEWSASVDNVYFQ